MWPGKTSDGVLPGLFFGPYIGTGDAEGEVAMPYFEDDEDPKKPRPVLVNKKREGAVERDEARKDIGRDEHRHVNVRC